MEQNDFNLRCLRVSERIVDNAKEAGLYIKPEDTEYGKGIFRTESLVFMDLNSKIVTKIKDPFFQANTRNGSTREAIYMHIIHNIYFPETNYKLIGITEQDGYMRLILEQGFVQHLRTPQPQEVQDFLESKGFYAENISKRHTDDVEVFDTCADNVLVGIDEKIYAIDPMFRLKRRALEIIKDHLHDNEYVEREVKTLAPVLPELQKILDEDKHD